MQLVTIQGTWKIKDFNKFSGVGSVDINIPDFAKTTKLNSERRLTTAFTLASITDGNISDFATVHLEKAENKYSVLAWGETTSNRTFNLLFTPYLVE